MAQSHLISLLRRLNHPMLQQYLELSDRVEQLGCQAEQIDREAAALEGKPSTREMLQALDQLEHRQRELRGQFWPVFHALQDLQRAIRDSIKEDLQRTTRDSPKPPKR